MVSILVMKQIAQLFLFMAMGFLVVKRGVLKTEDSKSLSLVAVYLVIPCVIINSFQIQYTPEVRDGLLLAFAAAVLIHIVLLAGIPVLARGLHLDPVEQASLIYSNAGNLIIPLVANVLGQEWVVYSSAFIAVQTVFIWTHGRRLLCEEKKINWKGMFCNINMIAVIVGIVLFATQIRLPAIIGDTMSSMGGMLAPLCMVVTGMLIGNVDPAKVLFYKRIYLITLLKMIICPVLILILIKISGLSKLHPQGDTILFISVLAVITPCASMVTQMAQIYNRDAQYASVINVVTTLVCIFTMPFLVFLYQM